MMNKKVLLIDDEIDFLTLMKKLIESWGYEVIIASNSKDAIELFKNEKPNAIILDYLMPDMDGVALLKKLRTIGSSRIPAIMYTAHPTIKAVEDGKELNISAFIPKVSPYVDTQADLKLSLDLLCKGI
jgi:CheY-like chemotaxis protein